MDVRETLIELAEEHLARMAAVPWTAYAEAIRRGKSGETFGCEVAGRYFDIGDQARWQEMPGGDILLTTHAATNDDDDLRVERQTVIARL